MLNAPLMLQTVEKLIITHSCNYFVIYLVSTVKLLPYDGENTIYPITVWVLTFEIES